MNEMNEINLQIFYFNRIYEILTKYHYQPLSIFYVTNYIRPKKVYFAIFLDNQNNIHSMFVQFSKSKKYLEHFENVVKEMTQNDP